MPMRLALAVRETVAGHRLGALEGGGGASPPPEEGVTVQGPGKKQQPDEISHRGHLPPFQCTLPPPPTHTTMARSRCCSQTRALVERGMGGLARSQRRAMGRQNAVACGNAVVPPRGTGHDCQSRWRGMAVQGQGGTSPSNTPTDSRRSPGCHPGTPRPGPISRSACHCPGTPHHRPRGHGRGSSCPPAHCRAHAAPQQPRRPPGGCPMGGLSPRFGYATPPPPSLPSGPT